MSKKLKADVRLYIDDDYKSYLKLLAEQREISLNKLLMELIEKKYPFNRKAKMLLKNATMQNCDKANEHTTDAGFDLPADAEQVSLEEPTLTSSTGVDDVALESVETHSSDVEITVTPEVDTDNQEVTKPDDNDTEQYDFDELLSKGSEPNLFTKKEKKAMKKRITEINNIIDGAKANNNPLPRDEYFKLVEQKNKLKKIVYPNGNN